MLLWLVLSSWFRLLETLCTEIHVEEQYYKVVACSSSRQHASHKFHEGPALPWSSASSSARGTELNLNRGETCWMNTPPGLCPDALLPCPRAARGSRVPRLDVASISAAQWGGPVGSEANLKTGRGGRFSLLGYRDGG